MNGQLDAILQLCKVADAFVNTSHSDENETWRRCDAPRFPNLSFLLAHRLFPSSPAMNHEALRGQPFYGPAKLLFQ